jgi:hypothetical protein
MRFMSPPPENDGGVFFENDRLLMPMLPYLGYENSRRSFPSERNK